MDIDVLGEAKERKEYWQTRNGQMDEDRRMIALERKVATSNVKLMVSNEPKVFYNTAVALISSFPPRVRMPLSINYTPEEKDKISKTERFATAILRQLDRRQMSRGQSYWTRELAYWTCGGWYAVFNIVRESNGEVEFIADLWDPMTVYPEWDGDGLSKCVRLFETDKKTAQALVYSWQIKGLETEFKEPTHDNNIEIVNYWRRDFNKKGEPFIRNAIYVAGQEVKKLTEEPFDHIPIQIGAVGSPDMFLSDWQTRWGENIIGDDREMYNETNAILTLMKTILSETAYPNIVSSTLGGEPAVKAEDLRGSGQVIPIRLQDKLEILKHAATPQEGFELLSYMLKQIAKGSFPDVVYGGLQVEISGFALSQLLAAIRYKIGPYWSTMQYVMGSVITDLLLQYKKGKFKKVTMPTVNPQSMKRGLLFVEDYEPSDVPDNCYVEVTIPIVSNVDKTQQIIQATQALGPPQLLSRETLWDDFLDVQDSEQEYARILQDQTLELPVVKELMMLEQLRKRADALEVNGQIREAAALRRHIMVMEMNLGLRQGIPVSGAGGVSPSTLPPEMMNSPDKNRAMAGIPPQGLQRPAQTPMQREQSQGRKGMLVSPTGEVLL